MRENTCNGGPIIWIFFSHLLNKINKLNGFIHPNLLLKMNLLRLRFFHNGFHILSFVGGTAINKGEENNASAKNIDFFVVTGIAKDLGSDVPGSAASSPQEKLFILDDLR